MPQVLNSGKNLIFSCSHNNDLRATTLEGASLHDAEFVCRKCGKVVSSAEHKLSPFCPKCGTFLQPRPQPKHWLFQFNPAAYNWFDRIKENKETEQWLTSQHAKQIHEGDMVAIWASGEKAGVYAIGQIITNPRQKALDPDQEKYWIEKSSICKFQEKPSAIVKYLKVAFDKPLLHDRCRLDSTLSAMQVFTNPQGTNFPLAREQWNRILALMEQGTTQTGKH
jgi:hypothetical protein